MALKELLLGDPPRYEIIPLGVNCSISHYLRSKGLRNRAFLFDWSITPMQSAIELLRNDFNGFMSDDNLVYLPPANRKLFNEDGEEVEVENDIITPVICKKYAMLFPHDFSGNGRDDFFAVQTKYRRRINRIRELLNSQTHLIFVANEVQQNDWQREQYKLAGVPFVNQYRGWREKLSTVLDTKYPDLSYELSTLEDLSEQIDGFLYTRLKKHYRQAKSLVRNLVVSGERLL